MPTLSAKGGAGIDQRFKADPRDHSSQAYAIAILCIGEVASLDLAVATGRGPDVLANLEGLRPLVRDEDVALVGFRAFDDNDHFLDEHVRDTAMAVVDLPEIQKQGAERALEIAMATVTKPHLEGFCVHFDVDVLDDDLMTAVDYHCPGGLTWEQAEEILGGVLRMSGARGLEVTIFNPHLDSDGKLAQRLSDLIATASSSSGA